MSFANSNLNTQTDFYVCLYVLINVFLYLIFQRVTPALQENLTIETLCQGPAAPASPALGLLPPAASRGNHLPWLQPPCTPVPDSLTRTLFQEGPYRGSALDCCVDCVILSPVSLINLSPCLDPCELILLFTPTVGDHIGEVCFLFGCSIPEPPFTRHFCVSPLVPCFGLFLRWSTLCFRVPCLFFKLNIRCFLLALSLLCVCVCVSLLGPCLNRL